MRLVCFASIFFLATCTTLAQYNFVPYEFEIHALIYDTKDYDAANNLIDSSAATYGNSVGHEVMRVFLSLASDGSEVAASKAELLLSQNPNSVRALLTYGYFLTTNKNYAAADSLYKVAESLCGGQHLCLYFVNNAQANNLVELYEYTEAITKLNAILVNYPRASRAHGLLGAIYLRQGKLDLSLQHSTKAYKYGREYYIFHNIAQVKSQQGKYKKAIKMFEHILKYEPEDEYTLCNLGFAYTQVGQLERGLQLLNKSIEVDPEHVYSYRSLGIVYLQQGDTLKACEYFSQALAYNFTKAYTDEVLKLQQLHCK